MSGYGNERKIRMYDNGEELVTYYKSIKKKCKNFPTAYSKAKQIVKTQLDADPSNEADIKTLINIAFNECDRQQGGRRKTKRRRSKQTKRRRKSNRRRKSKRRR